MVIQPDRGARLLQQALAVPDFRPALTPVEEHGGVLVKREDAWARSGAAGAKARAMFQAARNAGGIVTAGSRHSPQLERAALVARALGIPARLHTAAGGATDETLVAEAAGAELLRHRPGRLSVLRSRYRTDANTLTAHGWAAIPYGMEHPTYLDQVTEQATHLPSGGFTRIVVPVGSGMTLAGICRGLGATGRRIPVLGVRVGGDPAPLLDRHAPGWQRRVTLATSRDTFTDAASNRLGDLSVDPHYEAKCLPYLRDGDLLWTVGLRTSAWRTSCRPQ